MAGPLFFEKDQGPAWTRAEFIMLGAILLVTFLLYAPALGYEFVYDDRLLILQNPQLLSWRFVPQFFLENFPSSALPGAASVYYRPVLLVWMLLNAKLWGMNPVGWHLTAIVLHLVVVVEVYVLARRLLGQPLGAALAAAVAALHPVHVECVAWVMAMAEQLAASLILGSFLAYLNARHAAGRKAWLALSMVLFALGVMVKENMIVLPGLILAYEWIFGQREGEPSGMHQAWPRVRTSLAAAAPYIALVIVYLAARIAVLKSIGQTVTPMTISTLLATLPGVLFSYLRILVWPVGLSVEYDTLYVEHVTAANFLLPATVVVLFVALLVWLSLRSRAAAFAAVWLVLPILPVLDLPVFPRDEIVHDRYLYFPSIGIALLVALAFSHLIFTRNSKVGFILKAAATAAILAILGGGTGYYRQFWKDNLTLFSRAIEIAPHNLTALNNFGNELVAGGKLEQALTMYQRALAVDPNYWLSASNAGQCLYRLGRLPEAEHSLSHAIALAPYDPDNHIYIGMTYYKLGRLSEAESATRRAIALKPAGRGYHLALGVILTQKGELTEALQEFRAEQAAFPDEAAARKGIEELSRRLASPVH